MKISNTAARLKQLIAERNLKQVDILNAAKPYCVQYGIKLEKNDLSQYVNGKVEPGQEKLTILGLALNVSETWLMGYDVPASRTPAMEDIEDACPFLVHSSALKLTRDESDLLHKYRALDDAGRGRVRNVLDYEYNSIPGSEVNSVPKEA